MTDDNLVVIWVSMFVAVLLTAYSYACLKYWGVTPSLSSFVPLSTTIILAIVAVVLFFLYVKCRRRFLELRREEKREALRKNSERTSTTRV